MCDTQSGGELAALAARVARLRSRARPARPGYEAAEDLRSLRKLCDALELEFATVTAEFAASGQWDSDGYASHVSWIRHECNMSGRAAVDALRVGEQQAVLPQSIGAMQAGEIGFAHLALMAGTANALHEAGSAARFKEAPLLAKAKRHLVNRFRRDCAHVRHAADQAAYLRAHLEDVQARSLELLPCEGGVVVKGFLDSVAGATLRSALEPLARKSGAGDERLRQQRLADALVELAMHRLDEGRGPRQGGVRPHLQVTASLETIAGLSGAPAGEMEFAAPVPAATVQRIACDASITRVILDGDSAIVNVGRARRLPTAAARKALRVRDQTCIWPGCDRAACWTQVHHFEPWAKGGLTNLDNLVLLCHRHHWMVHEGGWKLVRAEDLRLVAVPPLPGYMPSTPWWASAA